MGDISIRAARSDDADFLALAMQEADRGHTGIGSWDVMLPGSDKERLATLAALACASQRSYVHWSMFLVAECDGRPVGTVAGYVPNETPPATFVRACTEVLGVEAPVVLGRTEAWSRDYFSVNLPGDTVRVEWVYTDPAFRGRGVSGRLIRRLLDEAHDRRWSNAHVGTYIGNEPALATYRRAGFEEFAECRSVDYEARFKTPGLVFLRRAL